MKKLLLLPLALAFASNAAVAANSVDLNVSGTITPAACDISIAGGGTFAFGSISATTLSRSGNTAITPITDNLNITCAGATLIGIKAIDNRPIGGGGDGYGIGEDGSGNTIGHYNLKLGAANVNAGSGTLLRSLNAGATWETLPSPFHLNNSPDRITSWNIGTGTDPVEVTSVTLPVSVVLFIADKDTFDTSTELTIDGSATIELVYL